MKKKLRVGILFGGRSGEHEISLLSANSILKAIDRRKYEVVPIGISKQGRWLQGDAAQQLLTGSAGSIANTAPTLLAAETKTNKPRGGTRRVLAATGSASVANGLAQSALTAPAAELPLTGPNALDVIFPVLHGTFGEDGTIQGLLELMNLAYVGSGVLGSAVGMDKDAMKRLFAAAGLPQTPHVTRLRSAWRADPKGSIKLIERALTYPLFVKPANLGSSVGISKVKARAELAAAMDLAASFDRKLVVEQGVGGPGAKPRELEVAVLGNDGGSSAIQVSVVGEIVPNKEFYDYDSKYADSPEQPSIPIIPAKITAAQSKQIRALALAAFRSCDCSGLARVDFLLEPTFPSDRQQGRVPALLLNEINTMPGFTSISMYPKLWQASGISYRELIDRLIVLAVERRTERMGTAYSRV